MSSIVTQLPLQAKYHRYNEGQFELSESRERLSTVTKKAVASLERVRDDQKPAPAKQAGGSLIDFATFEDRLDRDLVSCNYSKTLHYQQT